MKTSKKIVEDYIHEDDWRSKENSNCTRSVGALGKYMISEVSKDYWLKEVYNPANPKIAEAYLNGFMHIHDLNCLSLYCCGFSLPDIIKKGVRGVPNIPTSTPAHHFMSIINQMSNLTTIFQNEIAGAVAFSSVDTLLAPFIKAEGLNYDQVKQFTQNWIFSINSNSRAGAEPAFSNVTFDLFPPKDLIDKECVIDGVPQGFTYRDCQPEMNMFNKAFFELMIAGDAAGNPFAYPIPTYNIAEGFDWDNPNNELLWEMAGKYGTPYFANYMNSDMDPSEARSMCPLLKSQQIHAIVDGTPSIYTLEDLQGKEFYTYYNGDWRLSRLNKVEPQSTILLQIEGNRLQVLGEYHLQPILREGTFSTKQAKDLMLGDYLVYDNKGIFEFYKILGIQEGDVKDDLMCVEVL